MTHANRAKRLSSSPPDFRSQSHVVRNQSHEGQRPDHAKDDDVDFLVGPANQVSHPIEEVHASRKNVVDLFCIHGCQVFSIAVKHRPQMKCKSVNLLVANADQDLFPLDRSLQGIPQT